VPELARIALSRVRSALHLGRVDEDFRKELASHIELLTDDNLRRGMAPDEARRQARMRLGGVAQLREENRAWHGLPLLETLLQDLRYGCRLVRRSPGFHLTAVVTLALAIGANAVVFATLNAFILRPLNVPRPDSLYSIHRTGDDAANQSYPDYLDLRDRNHSFEDLAAYNFQLVGLDTGDSPVRAWGVAASGNYFDVLGLQPFRGRLFHASDEHGSNSAPFVVLGHAYWHARFHDDPGAVGRVVQINKHPFTIVGVAPPEFRGTLLIFNPDFYVPIVNQEQLQGGNRLNDRGNRDAVFMTLGHLRAGITLAQAAADVNAIWADVVRTYPDNHRASTFVLARPGLYGEHLGRPIRTFLSALMLLAVLILVAACANLGSLFAARGADRAREIAMRLALGARRLRIGRQLFTEALVIAFGGGALGLWGALLLLRSLRTWQPFPQWPLNVPLTPDANVYAVAALLAVASGLLFGAVPVRQALRTDPYATLKSVSQTAPGGRLTVRDLLVVGQIAICAVLVTASLVAVRGLSKTLHDRFGFEPQHAILVNTNLDMAGYRPNQIQAMQKRMLEAMQTIPGVTSAAFVDRIPLNGDASDGRIFRDDTSDLRPANAAATVDFLKTSPDFLRAAGTALLIGREFTWHDDGDAPRVVIVNQELARRMFGSAANAMGRFFKLQSGTRLQVVGVVEDGKYESLTEDPIAAMLLPILQWPASDTWLVVRSDRDLSPLAMSIRDRLRALDPGLLSFIQSWDDAMALPLFPARMATAALGVLGILGAVLSVTGIFGMAAYSISRRLKELGVRMALGAQRREVLQASLGRPFKLLAAGSGAGLLLGIVASRVLAFIVYEATPRDPLILAGTTVAMALLGLLATWIPARRAMSIDPSTLLREN
jgi:predicted permease